MSNEVRPCNACNGAGLSRFGGKLRKCFFCNGVGYIQPTEPATSSTKGEGSDELPESTPPAQDTTAEGILKKHISNVAGLKDFQNK